MKLRKFWTVGRPPPDPPLDVILQAACQHSNVSVAMYSLSQKKDTDKIFSVLLLANRTWWINFDIVSYRLTNHEKVMVLRLISPKIINVLLFKPPHCWWCVLCVIQQTLQASCSDKIMNSNQHYLGIVLTERKRTRKRNLSISFSAIRVFLKCNLIWLVLIFSGNEVFEGSVNHLAYFILFQLSTPLK